MKKLALFDIDGTLTRRRVGADTRKFDDAIFSVHGLRVSVNLEETDGLTDRLVLKKYLDSQGIKDYRFEECFEALYQSFMELFRECGYELLEGVQEILDELQARNVIIGHVTGNTRKIAKVKMECVGIGDYFAIGGYGCFAHTSRHELVRAAIEEAQRKLEFVPNKNNVFLFGDTPRDVVAGKKSGVVTIACCTGSHSGERLQREKPDLTVKNMREEKTNILRLMNVL